MSASALHLPAGSGDTLSWPSSQNCSTRLAVIPLASLLLETCTTTICSLQKLKSLVTQFFAKPPPFCEPEPDDWNFFLNNRALFCSENASEQKGGHNLCRLCFADAVAVNRQARAYHMQKFSLKLRLLTSAWPMLHPFPCLCKQQKVFLTK